MSKFSWQPHQMFTEDVKTPLSYFLSGCQHKKLFKLCFCLHGKLYEKVVQTSRVWVVQKVINPHQQNVQKRKWMKISSTNPPLHDGWPQSLYSMSVYIYIYIYGEGKSEASIGLKFDKVMVCDISLDFETYFVGCTMK